LQSEAELSSNMIRPKAAKQQLPDFGNIFQWILSGNGYLKMIITISHQDTRLYSGYKERLQFAANFHVKRICFILLISFQRGLHFLPILAAISIIVLLIKIFVKHISKFVNGAHSDAINVGIINLSRIIDHQISK